MNVWGGAMYDELAAWLPDCGADVLCLQEVTRTADLSGWTKFEDGERSLPQRANLFADLQVALPRHQGNFLTSDAGPVLDGDGYRHQQDFGIATFVHERLAIVGQRSTFVHGSFLDHAEWAIADRPRIASATRLIDRRDGRDQRSDNNRQEIRTITVAHLHGLRDPAGKADSPARLAQADRLAELVSSTSDPGDLVVLCGDLNLLPDSETFDILARAGLTDLVGEADTRTSRYAKPVRHANYMLVSDPGAVQRFTIAATPEVSDHRILILDI